MPEAGGTACRPGTWELAANRGPAPGAGVGLGGGARQDHQTINHPPTSETFPSQNCKPLKGPDILGRCWVHKTCFWPLTSPPPPPPKGCIFREGGGIPLSNGLGLTSSQTIREHQQSSCTARGKGVPMPSTFTGLLEDGLHFSKKTQPLLGPRTMLVRRLRCRNNTITTKRQVRLGSCVRPAPCWRNARQKQVLPTTALTKMGVQVSAAEKWGKCRASVGMRIIGCLA